jgi:cholesterol transport system auxiliary component
MTHLTRRMALVGAICSLGGCSAISSLNASAEALDTYDLQPAAGSVTGGRIPRTLQVALPQAPAALVSDRIMIKPDAVSITYLPDARWSDEVPALLQTLLVRSIAATGRAAYVGSAGSGPVPDKALLVRIDAFEVVVSNEGTFTAQVDFDLSVINDRDQRVVGTRRFSQSQQVVDDTPASIVSGFQALMDGVLPAMSDWAIRQL